MSVHTTATVDVTVTAGPKSPGTVADWELFFARRALNTLKSRLGEQVILDLLRSDFEASGKQFAAWAAASEDQWQPARTELSVSGMTAEEFVTFFSSILTDVPKLLAAQPEHFATSMDERDGKHVMRVTENLSRYISDFYITMTGEDQAVDDLDPDYPVRMAGVVTLADGTVVGHMLHQFRDTVDGFDALVTIYFPVAAPEDFVEGHRQHLAVEFTNWFLEAADSLGRSTTSSVPLVVKGTEVFAG